jgi:hypothetical protein
MICKNPSCFMEFTSTHGNKQFCSDNCRNVHHVRRWRSRHKHKCKLCPSMILPDSTHCTKCSVAIRSEVSRDTTLAEYHLLLSLKGKHPSWLNAHLRYFARFWNSDLSKGSCQRCHYALHVEIAHIRAVSTFPETATIGEVNARSNVLGLCPNCHWEFDNGLLKMTPTGLEPV